MAEGKAPEQQAIDEIRREARLEALTALRELELFVRGDEGMGGVDAGRIGLLSQRVSEKVRVYRMTVNVGDEPTYRMELAETDRTMRRGMRRRSLET